MCSRIFGPKILLHTRFLVKYALITKLNNLTLLGPYNNGHNVKMSKANILLTYFILILYKAKRLHSFSCTAILDVQISQFSLKER